MIPGPAARRYKKAYVEISNVCNLKCDFCPTVDRQKQVMDPALFRKVAKEIAPFTDEVCLHLMGEPLGHSQFEEFVAICAEVGLPVNVTTNGTLIQGVKRQALLSPAVRQVNVSVHSFEANFGERNVSGYLARVFGFIHEAREKRPDLYINLRLWDLSDPSSSGERNTEIRRRIEEEFDVDFASMAIDVRRKKSYRLAGRIYVNFDSRFVWPSPELPVRSSKGFCHGLSSHFGIHADGTLVPCCLDKEASVNLGNCRDNDVGTLLEAPRAVAIRSGFAKGELVEDLCRKCPFIERFDKKAARLSLGLFQ